MPDIVSEAHHAGRAWPGATHDRTWSRRSPGLGPRRRAAMKLAYAASRARPKRERLEHGAPRARRESAVQAMSFRSFLRVLCVLVFQSLLGLLHLRVVRVLRVSVFPLSGSARFAWRRGFADRQRLGH